MNHINISEKIILSLNAFYKKNHKKHKIIHSLFHLFPFKNRIRKYRNASLQKQAKKIREEENQKSILYQDQYDLSFAKKAKKVVIFIEIEPYPMCGGQMNLFSCCKYSQQVLGGDIPVLMTTMPGDNTYHHNNYFINNIDICRWSQIIDILANKEEAIIHIPEVDILNPETGEEMLRRRLTVEDIKVLKKINNLRINIFVQEINKMPPKEKYKYLFDITNNISMTTAHPGYSTQDCSTKFNLPLKRLSCFIDLTPYEKFAKNKIEKIIILSPDYNNPYRQYIAQKLREKLEGWEIIDFYRMTFTECMELTSRSFATITFGEGLDGYFIHPIGVKRLGFAVYNEQFFPDSSWKKLFCCYSSWEEMDEKIVDDIIFLYNNPKKYEEAVEELTKKTKNEYVFDEYIKFLSDFYKNKFDFYPHKFVYIVGGNGFARECYIHLNEIMEENPEISFGGFLGHGGYGKTVDYKDFQIFYKGEVSEHKFLDNEYVVIGAGYPKLRKQIYNDLKKMNCKFYTLVSGSKTINKFVDIGEGNIFNHSFPSPNVKIGNGNVFNYEVIIAHDVEIGDFNFFGPRSQILGDVKIGNSNTVGANTIFLPHSKVGNSNSIAPLSCIYKGCKNNCYIQGNPALKIGDIQSEM
ncbi:MAG: hypothetical protein J6W62_07475 [Spirochaetia bacterium]|nr:hypothetical protein [Spirochaetia bacterium]